MKQSAIRRPATMGPPSSSSLGINKKHDTEYYDEEPATDPPHYAEPKPASMQYPPPDGPSLAISERDAAYPFRLALYLTVVTLIIITFSYSFERHLRIEMAEHFAAQLDLASEAIFTAKQRSQLEVSQQLEEAEGDGGPGGGMGGAPCPICGAASALSLPLSAASSLTLATPSLNPNLHKQVSVQDVLDSWRSRHDGLVDALTRLSRELLLAKYGPSPYYVRLDLAFPLGQPEGFIVMELDGDAMPYTTTYFLEQITARAWDSCQFILNAGVLLQVDTRGERCSRKSFRTIASVGEALAFQEYSAKLAHRRMTVGITGRPGGPLFYVSLINNTATLGPRVGDMDMGPFGLAPEADPCFGRVIRGEEVMERVNRLPVREGGTQIRLLQEFVTISRAYRIEQQQGKDLIKECDPTINIC